MVHQAVKRDDPIFQFAATQDAGAVDIERRQVSPRSTSSVLMFDAHGRAGLASLGGMPAGARLDAGLLISRDHKLIVLQGLAIPKALVLNPAAAVHGTGDIVAGENGGVNPGATEYRATPKSQLLREV